MVLDTLSFECYFRQCAPQLRFLFICNVASTGEPWKAIEKCKNLAHLCVIRWDKDLCPILYHIIAMELQILSLTSTWTPTGRADEFLCWASNLQAVFKRDPTACDKIRLCLIPEFDELKSWEEEFLDHTHAVGFEWGSFLYLKKWGYPSSICFIGMSFG